MTRARDISRLLGRTDNELGGEDDALIGTTGGIVDSAFVLAQTPQSAGFTFYSTLDSLPSNADQGSLAFVEANTRMYLNDGDGWYSIAAVNLSPSMTLSPSGTITLASDGTPSTVTITATDTDDPAAILSYSVESDGNMKATGVTVTQDSSVFTIDPLTSAQGGVAGNFTLTFKVSDQIDEAIANKSFSITYQSTGTLVRNTSYINEGGSVTFTLPVYGYQAGDTIPYSITGISASDINEGLTGNMVVSGNNLPVSGGASKTITATADFTTEGTEYMTFSADNQSVNVQIVDTSISNNVDWVSGAVYHSGVISTTSATNYFSSSHMHSSLIPSGGLDYTSIGGRPKTVIVMHISWSGISNGIDLNPTYFVRSSGVTNWPNVYQNTSVSYTNMGAFVVAPASIGVSMDRITFTSNDVRKFAYTTAAFYSDNGIDMNAIKYQTGYGSNGSTSLPSGDIKNNWSQHECVCVNVTTGGAAGTSGSYPYGRPTNHFPYSSSTRGYFNGSNGNDGLYHHGFTDLGFSYLPSYSISHNTYPYSPIMHWLLLQKT